MLLGQGLGLPFGEAVLGQALDKAVGVDCDGCRHVPIMGSARRPGNNRKSGASEVHQ